MKSFLTHNRTQYIGISLLFFAVGLFGWYAHGFSLKNSQAAPTRIVQVREFKNPNGLTNPLLYTDTPQASAEYNNIHADIESSIKTALQDNSNYAVSVYFRDLNTGRWTGVNENDNYTPSSMLKVLTMMVYFSNSDTDPEILQKKLLYEAKDDPGQNYKPEKVLNPGEHTVNELINSMIRYSDNNASIALTTPVAEEFKDLFDTLRISYPEQNAPVDFMSPKSYSILFRTLYSSTFLSHYYSETALKLLTMTTFNRGLVAGVPQGTTIAHKFGEHTQNFSDGSVDWRELHDCGIIYYPNHPYLLCVMTKGKDFPKLESTISTISKIVYQDVDKRATQKK